MTDKAAPDRLLRFLLGLFVLFPLVLVAWYGVREWLVSPPIWLADQVLTSWFPRDITRVWQEGDRMVVELRVHTRAGAVRYLERHFDAGISGTGLPLFVVLTALSSRSLRDGFKGLAIGVPVVLVGQVLTLVAGTLIQPPFVSLLREADGTYLLWAVRAADLGGYLGLVVFQTVLPLILWMLLFPDFVRRLLPSLSRLRGG